eukprot:336579-Rhodomonas_salina.2
MLDVSVDGDPGTRLETFCTTRNLDGEVGVPMRAIFGIANGKSTISPPSFSTLFFSLDSNI